MPEMMNDGLKDLNEQARKQAMLRRKLAARKSAIEVGKAAVTVAGCSGLNHIGFISGAFFLILVCGCCLMTAFRCGKILGAA